MASVLTFSNTIRERQLQTNLGLYNGYDFKSDNISYYSFHTKPLHSLTGGGTLYEYTHNEKTDYSKQIGHLYFKHRDDFQPYINTDPINPQNFWGGEYHDYYDYVNTVYGQITPPIRFIEGLISTQFLDEAIRVTSPAVVHNPEPTLSLNGAIKTNVNNFSGTDTRTGLLGNQMYAHALYHGANFNTMRKNTTSFINNSITPSVGVRFGNSDYTINSLSNIVSAIRSEGRIIEDYNQGIGVIDDISTLYQDIEQYETRRTTLKERRNGSEKEITEAVTYKNVLMYDINPTNLFKTLELNDYFDKNTKKFKPYAGTKWDNGETFIGEEDKFNTKQTVNPDEGITRYVYSEMEEEYDAGSDVVYRPIEVYLEDEDGKLKEEISSKSLLSKTNSLLRRVYFKDGSLFRDETKEPIYTPLGFDNYVDTKFTFDKTTISDTSTTYIGRSRGRNLLKKDVYKEDNNEKALKDNPFCRTWTYHNQYNKINKLVRPFSNEVGETMTVKDVQDLNQKYRAHDSRITEAPDGGKYLSENSVLNKETGIVNISPSKEGKVDIKKCMFSIENLAWKDVLNKEEYLSKEQRGPNGGRIMWFPPYDLNFSENTNANWESNTFIGRGEKMYTYSNTDRTGSLSFTLLIDHPSTIHNIRENSGTIKDDDILRFFAGCEPMERSKFTPKKGGETTTQTSGGTDGGTTTTTTTPKTEEKSVTIYVYFPNNYSGHHKTPISSSSDDTTTAPDDDFLDYMINGFCGNYGDIGEDIFTGYEMRENGISIPIHLPTDENGEIDDNDTFIKQGYVIYRCKEGEAKPYHECQNVFKPKIDNNDTQKYYNDLYYYRVDTDLRQKLYKQGNYRDTTSYQLNSLNGGGTCQFTELAYILAQKLKKETIVDTLKDEEKVKNSVLLNILKDENLVNITNIKFTGSASAQDRKNSEMLAKRRCATLRHLFKTAFSGGIADEKYEIGTHEVHGTDESVNIEDIKRNRFASITITYKTSKTDLLEEGTKDPQTEKQDTSKQTKDREYYWNRYEDEAQYFDKLKYNDPLTFKRLTDKYKYFTPAFHSVSPEGFNARLTFLQQCTRQGHTIEPKISTNNLDKPTEVAGNLAFGRMPVCVLRIGDFIYSRIIITSMNINYGDNQWDLNPEGAGVQPMMAKVSLGITILGGQSLEGPISKLQNAVTFNYYANAGVYDNRADRAKPVANDNQWSTDYYYTWEPKEWKPQTETQTTTNQTTNS